MTEGQNHLTEQEISVHAEKFQSLLRILAMHWYRVCKRKVDLDFLLSELNLALFTALRRYRHDGGEYLHRWVERCMRLSIKKSVMLYVQEKRRLREVPYEIRVRSKTNRRRKNILPGLKDDPIEFEKVRAAEQIQSLLQNQMQEMRWQVFKWRFIDNHFYSEIAAKLGISIQAAQSRCEVALKHAQDIIGAKPEFARYAVYASR